MDMRSLRERLLVRWQTAEMDPPGSQAMMGPVILLASYQERLVHWHFPAGLWPVLVGAVVLTRLGYIELWEGEKGVCDRAVAGEVMVRPPD